MSYNKGKISEGQLAQLFSIEENHFNDFKSKDISGRQFSKIVSALANASGGDVYIGIREENTTKLKHWEGFKNIEDANSLIQVVESLTSIENYYDLEFLQHPVLMTYILKFTVFKTQSIIKATDGKIYVRRGEKLTVAGELLFADEPQICLPKRSSIKIFRYKTSGNADRDTLADQPITVEGCAYRQIYDAVAKTKEIIESIRKLGKGFEIIEYPEETLHEIITNAVLHRDYSIATDIQIRIFDNRVEVESPGKLPGHVTMMNILEAQAARNPKLVRLINKFPNAPNKDVGEGLNTAFEAMTKLRLKTPKIEEKDNSVLVIIKHEKLASPEELIVSYLLGHDTIKNGTGRTVTGIKSENTMKNVFYRLRDRGFIQLIHGYNYWKKTDAFERLVHEQFKNLLAEQKE